MNQMTYDLIKSEEVFRKYAIRENPAVNVIDALFANDFDISTINEQIKNFIVAVSIIMR